MPVKVLLVDDLKNFLDLEMSFLKRTECVILKAANGLDALRVAKSEKPDVIFLDLEMPVMNGIECCRFIRSDVDLKKIPIVIVTASPREQECYNAGCNSYLRKPIDEDIFLSEIKKFVQIKERNDPRFNVTIPANVVYKGTKTSGSVLNISKSGFLLETEEPFGIGSTITVDFTLPDRKNKVKVKGMIVRNVTGKFSENKGFGLSFLDLAEKHQLAINSFMDERLKNS